VLPVVAGALDELEPPPLQAVTARTRASPSQAAHLLKTRLVFI